MYFYLILSGVLIISADEQLSGWEEPYFLLKTKSWKKSEGLEVQIKAIYSTKTQHTNKII